MTGILTPPQGSTHGRDFWATVFANYKARILHPVNLTLCGAGAVVTALIGPFDTYASDTFAFRLLFWSVIVFTATLLANFLGVWSDQRFFTRPYWVRSAVGAVLFTLSYFAFVWTLVNLIYTRQVLPHPMVVLVLIAAITLVVYVTMWVFATMLEKRLEEQMVSPAPQPTPQPAPEVPADPILPTEARDDRCPFLKRLGPDGGRQLIRLSMSDHYIEAHTDTGTHLVYMRFADAIAELKPQNGTQVHRSHWVNFSQIEEVIKNGQKITFRMSDGAIVPVSRSRKKALQDIGVL